jgi:hypothetical protein
LNLELLAQPPLLPLVIHVPVSARKAQLELRAQLPALQVAVSQ